MLTLVMTGDPPEVRLTDGEHVLARRPLDHSIGISTWQSARDALDRHNSAVMLEQVGRIPGVLPLPADHVPAAEHFMVAVHTLFPDYAAESAD